MRAGGSVILGPGDDGSVGFSIVRDVLGFYPASFIGNQFTTRVRKALERVETTVKVQRFPLHVPRHAPYSISTVTDVGHHVGLKICLTWLCSGFTTTSTIVPSDLMKAWKKQIHNIFEYLQYRAYDRAILRVNISGSVYGAKTKRNNNKENNNNKSSIVIRGECYYSY